MLRRLLLAAKAAERRSRRACRTEHIALLGALIHSEDRGPLLLLAESLRIRSKGRVLLRLECASLLAASEHIARLASRWSKGRRCTRPRRIELLLAVVADRPLLALGDAGLVRLCSIELQSCLPLLLAPATKWTRLLLSRLLHGEQVLRLWVQSAGWMPHCAS